MTYKVLHFMFHRYRFVTFTIDLVPPTWISNILIRYSVCSAYFFILLQHHIFKNFKSSFFDPLITHALQPYKATLHTKVYVKFIYTFLLIVLETKILYYLIKSCLCLLKLLFNILDIFKS